MAKSPNKVYDLLYPSPINLKDISAIVIAVNLWRREIRKHRTKKTLKLFDPAKNIHSLLKSMLPHRNRVPSTVHHLIIKYTKTLGTSLSEWLECEEVYLLEDSRKSKRPFRDYYILQHFDNFAYDFDGKIHYERTAKRIIRCDEFTADEMFRFAASYCLEDEIVRLWPFVSPKLINADEIDLAGMNEVHSYWICRQRKSEFDMPDCRKTVDRSVEEYMLNTYSIINWSCVKYFWDHADSEKQWEKLSSMCTDYYDLEMVARYMLPMLDDQLFQRFMDNVGIELVTLLLKERMVWCVLPVWLRIKDHIAEYEFNCVVDNILSRESIYNSENYEPYFDLGCKMWKTASEKLRISAIQHVVSEPLPKRRIKSIIKNPKLSFVLVILRYACFEQKCSFGYQNWNSFIVEIPAHRLSRLINVFFGNEKDVGRFFEGISSAKHDYILPHCFKLLDKMNLPELNEFLNLCCPDQRLGKCLKREILRTKLLGQDSILQLRHIRKTRLLSLFVNDAYEDGEIELADFKNQLISSPVTIERLLECIRLGYFSFIINFVDSFASLEQDEVTLKERIVDAFELYLIKGSIKALRASTLKRFVKWCLKTDEKIEEFKQSLPVDEIYLSMKQAVDSSNENGNRTPGSKKCPEMVLNEFLKWYFVDPERIEEFELRF